MSETRALVRGFTKLAADAIVAGTTAVETVHRARSKRTFDILESVPAIRVPACMVHACVDVTTGATYASIRLVTRGLSAVVVLAAKDPV